jgi:hypothetical protein
MEVKVRESGDLAGLAPGPAEPAKTSAIEPGKNETRTFVFDSFSMPHPCLVVAPLKKSLSGSWHQVFGPLTSILRPEEAYESFTLEVKLNVGPPE